MKVLIGSFTFLDEKLDGAHRAIIHEAKEIELTDDFDLELLLIENDGYLIPSMYTGQIVDERV